MESAPADSTMPQWNRRQPISLGSEGVAEPNATHNGDRPSSQDGQRPPGRAVQRAFMVTVLPAGEDDQLAELAELLRTSGVAAVGELIQRRDQPHPNSYLGKGKLEELKLELG